MKFMTVSALILTLIFAIPACPSFAAEPGTGVPAMSGAQYMSDGSQGRHNETSDNGITTLDDIKESSWLKVVPTEKSYLSLVAGRSHILRFSKKIKRLSVSDPEIVDFVILSPTEVLLNAKREGSINVIAWDYQDAITVFDVGVTRDPGLLMEVIKRIDPAGKFKVYPSSDVFVVEGKASTEQKARQIEQAANAFAAGSVSLVEVKEAMQILLRTRFVQVDRNRDYDFGLNIETGDRLDDGRIILQRFLPGQTNTSGSGQTLGEVDDDEFGLSNSDTTLRFQPFTRNFSDLYQATFFEDNNMLNAAIKAAETKGIIKTIARPNLLCRDGEEASFLVGGEAAIVLSTGDDLSVTYREFGTRLTFTPQLLDNGKIRLTVQPELSALNAANGVTVGSTSVPGFSTTRVNTVVELRDGETYVIGGLLQQKVTKEETGVPFLRRIPVFGKLFENTNEDVDMTELIVIVTPEKRDPETAPLGEGEDSRDILSVATKMLDNPTKDEYSDAISQYWKDRKRFVDKPPESIEGEGNGDTFVQVSPPLDSAALDDLEAKLQWKSGSAAAAG